MGLILILVAGFIMIITVILSIFGMVTKRESGQTDELKREIDSLQRKVSELESENKNATR